VGTDAHAGEVDLAVMARAGARHRPAFQKTS
jgi:hypothetical protein